MDMGRINVFFLEQVELKLGRNRSSHMKCLATLYYMGSLVSIVQNQYPTLIVNSPKTLIYNSIQHQEHA